MDYSLNKDKMAILRTVMQGERSLMSIAEGIGRSISWTSSNISSLKEMGLVNTQMRGLRCYVERSDTDLSKTLYGIISEYPYMKIDVIFSGKAFSVLPWLIDDGFTSQELIKYSGVSKNTVSNMLRKWMDMGIISKKDRRYKINHIYPRLSDFLRSYWKRINNKKLKNSVPEGTIVWQWRDQYIFALNRPIEKSGYPFAAMTRLSELGYDIISRNYYYFYGKFIEMITPEEAIIQSLLISDRDPRIMNILESEPIMNRISSSTLISLASKYGLSLEDVNGRGNTQNKNKG